MRPEPASERRLGLRRGTYLLPSLFTFGNILLGFYALVSGFRGEFEKAAVLIYIAAILDGLDGRIARLTHTESDFGREFDSLADLLTFGIAPAFVAYMWGLSHLGRLGWLIAVSFVLCASIRLARYNVQMKSVDSRFFVGLPAPAAAGTVASLLFFWPLSQGNRSIAAPLMISCLLLAAGLMVSTFRYRSFKELDLRRRWSYRAAALLGILVLMIAYRPTSVFFSLVIVYSLSGPAEWAWRRQPWLGSSANEPRALTDETRS